MRGNRKITISFFSSAVYEGLPPAPSLKKSQSPLGINYSLKFSFANRTDVLLCSISDIINLYQRLCIYPDNPIHSDRINV